jgi:hypothetical protein
LIDMVVSAKNSSSSTPVRSRVNVSPVRISAPAACSHTSREAMRCGTCSAQRTAHSHHSAQRTAHSITHCGLSCRHSACGPQAHAWLPTGCTSPGRPEERPALPVTSTARHGTARHGTARAANVQRAVARRYANELPTSHSPVPRAQPRGPVPHSACVPHRLVELLRAVRFGLGVRLAQIRREPRVLLRGHARTHALFAALLAPTDSREDRLLRSSRRILTTRQRIATDSRALCPSQRLVPPRSAVRPLAPPAATRVRGGRRSPPKWHTRSLGVKTSIPSHRTDQAEWAKHCGAAAQWRQCRHRIPRPRGSVRCTSTGGCMHACCTRACSRVGLLSVWRAPIQPAQLFPLHALHAPPPPPSPPRSATQVTMQV